MQSRISQERATWLAVGLLAGLCVAHFWPHEPAQAITVDRTDKYAMATGPVSITERVEAVFVLDFLTGRLEGRVLNPSLGVFTHSYFRNVAADFEVDPRGNPQYAIVAGQAQLASARGVSMASGVVYVAELLTGKVICYGFPYNETNRRLPPTELKPLDVFQFREPVAP